MNLLRKQISAFMIITSAVMNSVVLIINPAQVLPYSLSPLVLIEDYETGSNIRQSGGIDFFSQVQNVPEQQSRLSTKIVSENIARVVFSDTIYAPIIKENINKPGARYLLCRNHPELNDTELYVLHRRLNT
jgi:hypothetical protein